MSELEQAEYDRRWSDQGYGADQLGYTPHFLKFMRAYLSEKAKGGSKALEIGCGDGFFSAALMKLGFETTGIDLSPVAVEVARKRNPEGTFFVHDLTQRLPFENSTFDAL